jgi:hypothetical protein
MRSVGVAIDSVLHATPTAARIGDCIRDTGLVEFADFPLEVCFLEKS